MMEVISQNQPNINLTSYKNGCNEYRANDYSFDLESDEDYEEQGFLWMCGGCQNRPTFETLEELFEHKKSHGKPVTVSSPRENRDSDNLSLIEKNQNTFQEFETNEDCGLNSQCSPMRDDSLSEDDIPLAAVQFSRPPSNASSDEIPLSNIVNKLSSVLSVEKKPKKIKTKKSSKEKLTKIKVSTDSKVKTDTLEDELPLNNLLIGENKSVNDNNDSINAKSTDIELVSKKMIHKCKICDTYFSTRLNLSVHKKTHLFEDTGCFKCATCGKLCPKYDNFTRHLTIHSQSREKKHQCEKCFSSFYNLADLKRHLILHYEVKPWPCSYCKEAFTRQDSLLIHEFRHTGVQYKKFTCKVCDKVLNSPSSLVMHSKTHSARSVFCPQPGCSFSCYLQSQLRQHLRKHSGEKPYQCAQCGRCFARCNDMKNHVRNVHDRIRPFKCPYCPKTFALVGNLRVHYATHSNERPYLCAQCGKAFNHPSTLSKHTVIMHNPWRKGSRTPKARRSGMMSPILKKQLTSFPGEQRRGKGKVKGNLDGKEKFRKSKPVGTREKSIMTKIDYQPLQVAQEVQTDPIHLTALPVTLPIEIEPEFNPPTFVIPTILVEQVQSYTRPEK